MTEAAATTSSTQEQEQQQRQYAATTTTQRRRLRRSVIVAIVVALSFSTTLRFHRHTTTFTGRVALELQHNEVRYGKVSVNQTTVVAMSSMQNDTVTTKTIKNTRSTKKKVARESSPSPVCYPFASLAASASTSNTSTNTNNRTIERIYFAHMRKAGGTTLRSYLRGVATTLGITFDVSEGGHFETPGNGGDPNTLYVTHLRDPFRRSISHFQYEVRWPCAQMVQNTSFSPSLENAANLTAWILERDYQHPSLDERTFTKQHRCDDTQKYLIDCATNCYIRWMNYPKGACDDQVFDRKSVYYYKALQSLRSYDVIVDTDRLFVNNNDGDGDATGAANNPYAASLERWFGQTGLQSKNAPMYCLRPSRNANRNFPLEVSESTRQLFFERNQADYDLYHDLVTCTVAASNQVLFPVGSSNLTLEDFVRKKSSSGSLHIVAAAA